MASSTKNVQLGVCRAILGGVDLGLTKGGVEVSVTTETYKVEVDQYGKTPVKEQLQGRAVSAKVPMAETTLRGMASLMPGSQLISDGAAATGKLTFVDNPDALTTVTVAGSAFTFVSARPTTAFQVRIGASIAETMENFINTLNRAGLKKELGGVTAKATGAAEVTLTVTDYGAAGNAVTLVATGGDVTASGATLTGGVNETVARLEVKTGAGEDLLDYAQELRLHPVNRPDHDFSQDFVIYRAATPGALQFAYKLDAERIFNADFNGYPHPVTGKLFAIGDPAA